MAQLKSTVVQGSLRVTDTTYTTDLVISGSKTAKYVLAAPNAADGAPTWRALANSDVGLGNVENTKLSTWAGTTNITTLGTITSGTWSATAIGATKGGTGQTTYTIGDILYSSAANTLSKLGGNTTTTRKFLRSVATTSGTAVAPAWDTVTKTDVGLSNVTNDAQIPKSVFTEAYQILYATGSASYAVLTANKSTTKKFLRMTGASASAGAAPAWDTVTKSDVGLGNVTDDAQVKASLGTAQGDMLYWSAASTPARLAKGGANTILTASGTSQNPAWTSTAATVTSATSTTANTAAYANLTLGNSANVSTTTAHSEGQVILYSAATAAHTLKGASTTTAYTSTLPNNTGILVSLSGGTAKGSTTKPIYVPNTGIVTECSTYAGGTKVTLNGTDKGASDASFYAPTGAGTANQILVSTGGTPGWKATANGAAYATSANGALTFGTLPIAQGGTGTNTTPNQYGIIYASSTTAYASTAAGTSGYLLQSNATDAPDWIQAASGVVPSTIVKRDDGGTIGVGNIVLQNTYTGLENTFIYMDNKNITRGTAPSADIGQWIQMRDTNATRISDISFIARTNNTMQIRLFLCDQVSDTSVANPSGLIIQKTIGSTGAASVTLDANTGRWRSLWVKAASGESQMGVESTGNSGNIFFYAQAGNGNVGVYTSKHSNLISYQYNGTVVVGDTSVGRLALNADGSAVLYSQTNHHLNLLANGNLVLYNSSNTIKWQTNTASSTRLVKNDITYLNMSEIERFKRLRPISFTYKPELRFADTSKQYGLLVEDLIYVYPELVSMPEGYDPNKFDIRKGIDQPIPGIKYQQFIPILINVVQLQQQEIETLKRKITEITAQ